MRQATTPSTLTFKRMSSASSPVEQLSSSAVSAASPARSVSGASSQPEADEVDRVIEGEEELLQTAALDSDQSVPRSSIENNQPVEALETSQQTSQQTWLRPSGAKRWADSLEDPDEEQFCGLANWSESQRGFQQGFSKSRMTACLTKLSSFFHQNLGRGSAFVISDS